MLDRRAVRTLDKNIPGLPPSFLIDDLARCAFSDRRAAFWLTRDGSFRPVQYHYEGEDKAGVNDLSDDVFERVNKWLDKHNINIRSPEEQSNGLVLAMTGAVRVYVRRPEDKPTLVFVQSACCATPGQVKSFAELLYALGSVEVQFEGPNGDGLVKNPKDPCTFLACPK